MAQSPSLPSSSGPRKRKFAEMVAQKLPSLQKVAPNQSFDTDELTTSNAISKYFQLMYDDQLALDQGSIKCLLDPALTSLQKLQGASQFSSDFHDCKPFAADSPMWSLFTTPVADAMVDLFRSPGMFHESPHVAAGTVKICSEEEPWEVGSNLAYIYYTRVLDLESVDEYVEILELSGRKHPEDLPFVVLQLQYLGFGSRGSSLLEHVMQEIGYPDVRLELSPAADGIHPSTRPLYSGSTMRTPKIRHDEDMSPGESTSRMRNFCKLTKDLSWRIFVWVPLEQAISNKLEWRTRKELGQVEAVLTDCVIPNFNKARGGWIHSVQLHPTISTPLKAMLEMLPKPRAADPTPPGLTSDLTEMLDLEQAFFRLLGNSSEFGNFFGPAAMQHLKREFVGAIRCIKGSVSSITLTKDLPQEAGHGLIDTSLDGREVGRSVALYQAMLTAIYDLEGRDEQDYMLIRCFDGSFIDFWHFFERHKWWGLLILLIGLFFRRALPYTIHSWSGVAGGIFDSNLLHTLARDLGVDSLQGPEAIAALKPEILDHPVIKQSYHVPQDYNFREKQGKVRPVRIGPGKLDYANHLAKGDPGDLFYRQGLFRYDKRRHTLLNGLSIGLNRLTEEHLASQNHPTTEKGKIRFLKEIRDEFERVVSESGVKKVLDEELLRQRIRDRAQGALLGKSSAKEEVEDDKGDDGWDADATKGERKRRRIEAKPSHPRNKGLLALGEPHSDERRDQLAGLLDDAKAALLLDQKPAVLWSDSVTALSSEFAAIFLNLKKNHSLQLARNAHRRTPEGIQAHIDNGKRLGQLRKEWALASRTSKTALMGGWTRAEQFEELTLMLPSLRLDMTSQAFEKSQRAAKCAKEGCLSRVFGKDKNAKHRCTEGADPQLIVKTSFDSYIRVLYPHDVLTLLDVEPDVLQLAAAHCHMVASPAIDWVLDENENLLSTFPFPLHIHSITGVVYRDENKPKDAAENFLMAADVVLREVCPGKNPLEMAARGGKKISAGAEKLYNSNQDIVWRRGYMDRLVETVKNSRGRVDGCICIQCGDVKLETGKKRSEMMIHGPCTRGPDSGARLQENFYWFCARKLTDLPYSMARIFLYRAVRGGMDKESDEKIANWKGLLEWSG